jgi:hypothetical protein
MLNGKCCSTRELTGFHLISKFFSQICKVIRASDMPVVVFLTDTISTVAYLCNSYDEIIREEEINECDVPLWSLVSEKNRKRGRTTARLFRRPPTYLRVPGIRFTCSVLNFRSETMKICFESWIVLPLFRGFLTRIKKTASNR